MAYKLLLVDDEEDILQLLKDYLELQGYMVILAHDGNEAIKKASLCPDLIILDINMPGMDGLEVCRRLRQHLSCPIIFLTARVTEQDKINGLLTGGDDYIIKPFSIDELGARITAHLRREARCLDEEIFMEVFDNLLSNAIRYAASRIEIILLMSDDKKKLILSVADNGKGKNLNHFGIGLYICKLLCEKHGGYLTLDNGLNKGAVVLGFEAVSFGN